MSIPVPNQSTPNLHIDSNLLLDFLNSYDCFSFVCSVVSTLLSFTKTFERAHDENVKQLELEKKRAQAEAEKEKPKLTAHKKGESLELGISKEKAKLIAHKKGESLELGIIKEKAKLTAHKRGESLEFGISGR